MSVVPLTLTISLCLVFTFIIFFLREHARSSISSAERDSLLPLAEETPLISETKILLTYDEQAHERTAIGVDCGCLSERNPPCAGCPKHAADRT